ncbi:MAG: bile acid:sodium symporter family protein [Kiritimatiellia bacterium]
MKKWFAANSFVLNILLIVLAAALFPSAGSSGGFLPVRSLKLAGVFLIFFNQGVLLPGEELRRGFLELKLHSLIQTTTYLLFPLFVGMMLWLSAPFFSQPDLRAGFLYLAFLPTTVSSAVALTSVAHGNVSGALFNCTLSSVIGVFLVPLLCVFFLGQGGAETQMDVLPILRNVSVTLLLPLGLGQALRSLLKNHFGAHKRAIRNFNNGVILFIIWTAFCESFLRNVWDRVSPAELALCAAGTAVLLALSSLWSWGASGALHLSTPSRITALFCGSQKTIAMGLPLSAMIFTGPVPELSLLVIPLMIYHPLQLILAGWLMPRLQSLSSPPSSESQP